MSLDRITRERAPKPNTSISLFYYRSCPALLYGAVIDVIIPVPTLIFDHLGHTQQDPNSGSILDSSIEENSPSIAEGTVAKGSTCQQLNYSFTPLIKPKKLSNKLPSSSIQQRSRGERAVTSRVELCFHRRHDTGILYASAAMATY